MVKREPIDPEPQTDDVVPADDTDETSDVATDSHLVETDGKS